jgi:hypothetical protein
MRCHLTNNRMGPRGGGTEQENRSHGLPVLAMNISYGRTLLRLRSGTSPAGNKKTAPCVIHCFLLYTFAPYCRVLRGPDRDRLLGGRLSGLGGAAQVGHQPRLHHPAQALADAAHLGAGHILSSFRWWGTPLS